MAGSVGGLTARLVGESETGMTMSHASLDSLSFAQRYKQPLQTRPLRDSVRHVTEEND